MARETLILWVGRHDRQPWKGLCEDYAKRIARSQPIRLQRIRAAPGEGLQRLEREADLIERALPDPSWLVALDARGRATSSERFAAKLQKIRDQWPHPMVFVVGSDLGLSPRIVQRARWRLSLGPMELGHEIARLVLCEQLYRALAIQQGIQYHRAPLGRRS